MKEYITTGKVHLFTGAVHLSSEQASVRMHALKKIKGDKYRITAPIEFMVGERIGFDGEIPMGMAEVLASAVPDSDAPA